MVIANIQSFTSPIFGVVGQLRENLGFFGSLGFDVQINSDRKTQKIKLYSVRALNRYLNEKYLIHGRAMAAISKFSLQIFKMNFNPAGENSSFIFTICVKSVPLYHFKLAYVVLYVAVKELFKTHF